MSLVLYGAYRALSQDSSHLEVEKTDDPVYYPNPKPYADKKITQEVIEKSTFQVLDWMYPQGSRKGALSPMW